MSSACRDLGLVLVAVVAVAGCKREEREFRRDPAADAGAPEIAMTSLSAGQQPAEDAPSARGRAFERNAYHLS